MSEPLYTRLQGDDGPAVVILHGLLGSGSNWNRITRDLAADHRVAVMDLPNHGQSPHRERMDYPDMAAAVAATMDHYDMPEATVVGHSMGGKVAMALALTEPRRVHQLLVADIAPVTYGDRGHGELLQALQGLDPTTVSSRSEASNALAEAIPDAGIRQFLLTNLEPRDGGGFVWRIPLATLAANLDVIAGFPALEGRYTGPTLFLYGERSDYVTAHSEPAIRAWFPEAVIEPLAGAGHWLHAEQPGAFAQRLRTFLSAA